MILGGGATILITLRKAMDTWASWWAAICTLPMYQLRKRTIGVRGPSTSGKHQSFPTAALQETSMILLALAKKRLAGCCLELLVAFGPVGIIGRDDE
jgi:hypothetical protein